MNDKELVVLMAEDDEHDVMAFDTYIVKPVRIRKFSEAIRTINLFWKLVELPGGGR